MTSTTQTSATKRPRRMAREPKPLQNADAGNDTSGVSVPDTQIAAPKTPKGRSKNEAVLVLLKRPEGATLQQMLEATGWLPHTTRAVLTGLKKKGHTITSEKLDGVRIYRATPSAAGTQSADSDRTCDA